MNSRVDNFFGGQDPGDFWHNATNEIDKSPLLLGIFVVIMFGARISGSHYNPLITFSYMIGNVRQGKFDRILGVFYIAA